MNDTILNNLTLGAKSSTLFNPRRGDDYDTVLVQYDKTIDAKDKVPELCQELFQFYASSDFIGEGGPGKLPKIPIYLKKGHPNSVHHLSTEDRAAIVSNEEKDKTLSFEEIILIMTNESLYLNIGGEYLPNEKVIVIYYENFVADNFDDYVAKIKLTIAHEFGHYFHRCIVGNALFNEQTDVADKLREALAEGFMTGNCQKIYKKNKDLYLINSLKERYNFWKKYFKTSLSYPNVLYLFINNGKTECIDDLLVNASSFCNKFVLVLTESAKGNKKGFDSLIKP